MPAVRSINNLRTLPAVSEFDKVPHCSEISLCKSSQCGLPYKLFHACLVISTGSAKSADEKEAHEAHLLTSARDSLGRARPDADPMFSSTVPVSDSSVFSDHIMSQNVTACPFQASARHKPKQTCFGLRAKRKKING